MIGKWSGQRDSDPRPTAWEAVALPTELYPLSGNTNQNRGVFVNTILRVIWRFAF